MLASRRRQCAKMVSAMGRITSTVLNIVLLSALLQIPYCVADSSNENEPQHFNISQDLLTDTQSSGFNYSDWMCLDEYLSSWDMHPLELESIFANLFEAPQNHSVHNCKCFLNFRCKKKTTAPASSSIRNAHSSSLVTSHLQQLHHQISLWFRCYELEESKALANFTEALSTSKLLGKLTTKLEDCIHSDSQAVSIIFDLVRGNRSNVQSAFEFINQLNSQANVHLESVSIRNSSLDYIPVSVLSNSIHLKSLNLTFNHLTEFDSAALFSPESSKQLVTLDLSHNRLTRVNLSRLVSLHLLDLSFNHLSTLATSELSIEVISLLKFLHQNKEKPAQLYFNFANNPWNCDDRLDWLIDFISAIVEANGTIFKNEHGLELSQTDEPECSLPQSAKVFPFSVWKSVKNVAICDKCSCHLEAKYAEIGYRYVIVNCTDKNLDYLPVELPKNTKVIDLSNNQVRKLSGTTRAKLSQWHHVNKIILQNNSLEALDGLDQIHSIVYLDISGNLLTEIPYHILDRDKVLSSKIDKILIGNNPYTCDCNTVKMQKWLQTNYRIIHDIANVRCGYMRTDLTKNESNIAAQVYNDRFHNREILKINNLELCPSIASVEVFDIINCILAFGIIFLLAKVTYDYFWQKRTGQLPRFWKLNI